MRKLVERPPEVEAEIDRFESIGDFEQVGYLMAPGLKAHTGDTFEGMLNVCALLDMIEGKPASFYQRNEGVKRWVNEQVKRGDDDGTDSEGGNQIH